MRCRYEERDEQGAVVVECTKNSPYDLMGTPLCGDHFAIIYGVFIQACKAFGLDKLVKSKTLD